MSDHLYSARASVRFPSLISPWFRAWRPVAGVVLAASLVACGGGGASGASTGNDGSATPSGQTDGTSGSSDGSTTTSSTYLVAGLARSATQSVFVVFDPAQPGQPLYTRTLGSPTQAQLWPLSGVDASGQGTLVSPYSAVSFLVDGHVEYMSLARGGSFSPRTLSTATDVCAMMGAARATLGSQSMSLFLVRRGPDCTAPSGYSYSNFPSSLTSTDTPPTAFADSMPTALPDVASARYVFARMQSSGSAHALELYSDLGVDLGAVSGATNLGSSTWWILGPEGSSQTTLSVLGTGSQASLRRLSWTGTAASLDSTAIHTFTSGYAGSATSTTQGTVFADGRAIYRVRPGAASSEQMLTATEAGFTVLALNQHVAALHQSPTTCPSSTRKCIRLEVVDQAGGSVRTLTFEGTKSAAPSFVRLQGSADRLLVVTPQSDGSQSLGVVDLDGTASGSTIAEAGVKVLGWVAPYGSQFGTYSWGASSVLLCRPDADGGCGGRELVQLNLSDSTLTTLGALPAAFQGSPNWIVYNGQPSAIGMAVDAAGSEDLYVVTPDQASSLAKVFAHP